MILPSIFVLVALSACAAPIDPESEIGLTDLSPFQWEHRLFVVFSQSADITEIEAQLTAEVALVDDRDILWFIVVEDEVTTNFAGPLSPTLSDNLRERYARDEGEALEVVLVGKDGGVKNRLTTLDTAGLYFQIDQMPMRQREMQDETD